MQGDGVEAFLVDCPAVGCIGGKFLERRSVVPGGWIACGCSFQA